MGTDLRDRLSALLAQETQNGTQVEIIMAALTDVLIQTAGQLPEHERKVHLDCAAFAITCPPPYPETLI